MTDLPTITPRADAEARREFPGMFRRDVIADACAAVATRARRSTQDYIEAGARHMLAPRQQWRITRAVYGFGLPPVWPPQPDVDVHAVLSACRAKIRNEVARKDHWTFDASRLIGLRMAERALLLMLEEGCPPASTLVDVYRCAVCGARRNDDLPDCPRATPKDCDILCETETRP